MVDIVYNYGIKCLYNLTKEQSDRIKSDLTFDNPNYYNALKFSKWDRIKVPKTLKYYLETKDEDKVPYISVPAGYKVPFEARVVFDDRVCSLTSSMETPFYPEFKLELRDIQEKAFHSFLKNCEDAEMGNIGTLVLPTGSGKTICGLKIASRLRARALVIVNKDDLVDGWTQDAKLCFGDDFKVGLVKGREFKIEDITITTIQTLSKLGNEKLKRLYDSITMLIVDECHRAGAKSYEVLNNFPAQFRLGLTATKMRNDGLVDVVDLICGKTLFDGTKEEIDVIIPARNIHVIKNNSNIYWNPKKAYFNTFTKQDIHVLKIDGANYFEGTDEFYKFMERLEAEGKVTAYPLKLHKAYELIAENESFNNKVCADIKNEYNKGKSCVVFCKTIEQLENLYDKLKVSCPRIQKFYGGMRETKEEVKRKAESKEALITLATISIACEGTNVKAWECGFLVSSIANEKDLIQILGRLRRTVEGKTDVYFYDYRHPKVAGIRNHGYKRDIWYRNLGIDA